MNYISYIEENGTVISNPSSASRVPSSGEKIEIGGKVYRVTGNIVNRQVEIVPGQKMWVAYITVTSDKPSQPEAKSGKGGKFAVRG